MAERINKKIPAGINISDAIGTRSPSYLSRVASSKVTPVKKGDIKFKSNILDMVGESLIQSFEKGKFTSDPFKNFKADIDFDVTDKWSLNLGYNQDMAGIRQALKATVSKKF